MSDDGWGWSHRQPPLPRGGPALSRQCFLSRLPGSRVPPSLLTAARGGFPPSWFYGWRQRVLSLGPDRQDGRVQASPTWTRWYGKAKKKALVLLCSRLAAANTSTSRSVALSSIFETQLHVFRSRIPLPHPQRALPHYGTPSTGTLCSVSWPTADLPRSVLGSSAHSWCRARSLRGRPFAPSTHMPLIGQAAAEPQRETRGGTYLNAMSPLFQFHGPLGSPLPLLLLSALVRPGWRGCCLPSHRTPPGLGTWSRPPCRIKLPWLLYANRPPGERRLWSPPQVVLFVAAHLQTDATPKLASHLQRPFPPT